MTNEDITELKNDEEEETTKKIKINHQ